MLFSSITFIYYFLPLLILVYFIIPNKIKNFTLLIFSLLFYFLGEPKYIIILILSCIINYYLSKLMNKKKFSKIALIVAILYNVGQLLFFKYTNFFISNINNIVGTNLKFIEIIMPIGISFYTFQALGYIIDVFLKKHKPAKSIIDFMTYISLFPQLVAGPIVRYIDVENDLTERKTSFSKFSEGIKRFIIGLSKKVLIANVLGEIIKLIVESMVGECLLSAWLKPILFTLQIYYDFSGYSDMAIGLGLMFGFRFLENFNYPFIASSITEFWRRWHMSLSSWFRDYVYIPLGGNKVSKIKWYRNILIVWGLTGFWHGASWNFILWGLYFGIILIMEKIFLKKFIDKTKVFKYIYTIIIVIISFLIFDTESINDIVISLKNMFLINDIPLINKVTLYQLQSNLFLIAIAIVGSTPFIKNFVIKLKETKFGLVINVLEPIVYIVLLTLTTAYLIDASFNPFLYFRF